MNRRSFLVNGTAASASLMLQDLIFSTKSRLKIGVLSSVFNLSGYSQFSSSITEYSRFKTARQDLLDGKIDVLISSPQLLSSSRPEFELFGAFPMATYQEKEKWLKENYSFVSAVHAESGLQSDYLGFMSPLMVRLSNLSVDQLNNWKDQARKVSVVASGARAVWFEHMGFRLKTEPYLLRLTSQLADLAESHLNLTESYAPALFLQSFRQNEENQIIKTALPQSTLVLADNHTKSGLPVEILYKNVDADELASIKHQFRTYVHNDIQVQNDALALLLQKKNFTFVPALPDNLGERLEAYQELHLQTLQSNAGVAGNIVERFKKYRGA